MASLCSLDGQVQIEIHESQCFEIRRAPDNDVIIEHVSVSAYHARLWMEDGILQIADLGSTNGIRVNSSEIDHKSLAQGDVVEIGNVAFSVQGEDIHYLADVPDAPPQAAPAKPARPDSVLEETMRNLEIPEDLATAIPPAHYDDSPEAAPLPASSWPSILLITGILILAGALVLLTLNSQFLRP